MQEKEQKKMAESLAAVARTLKGPGSQIGFLTGLVVIVIGLSKVYEPLAWTVAGLIICLVAARLNRETE